MIPDLLFRALDILVAGLIVVFVFLLVLTLLTKLLVTLFPEQSSHTDISHATSLKPQPLSKPQQAAIAVAVHRYRRQHKQEGKLL